MTNGTLVQCSYQLLLGRLLRLQVLLLVLLKNFFHLDRVIHIRVRYALKKKLRYYLEIFPPPIPPFWEPLIRKKNLSFILHFRPLGKPSFKK